METTPKAITALSKLLQSNYSSNKQSQIESKSGKTSKHGKSINKNEFKNLILKPSPLLSPNYSVKNELINVLNNSKTKASKSSLKNQYSLNYLLSSQQQYSARNSFQKKRPPQINVEESTDIQKQPFSAKNINQISPLHYCPNQKHSQLSQKSIRTSKGNNVFSSLNEILNQYVQKRNYHKQAGTGEGIKITSSRSARNADKLEQQTYLFDKQKLTKSYHDTKFDSQKLKNVQLFADQIIKSYKTKEIIWKLQKKSLKQEIYLLKELLQQQQQLQDFK